MFRFDDASVLCEPVFKGDLGRGLLSTSQFVLSAANMISFFCTCLIKYDTALRAAWQMGRKGADETSTLSRLVSRPFV